VQGQGIITAEAGAKRLASVYGSPNNVGLMLGRAIPFALAFVLIYTNTIRRVWGLSALIVMSIALALTQSVGAILLGIPASIVVILVALYGRRSILPIAGVGILGGVGFGILTQISARFANILDLSNGTNFFRLRVWESALEIIQDYPLTGIGLDQFLYMFRGHYIRPDAIWDRDLSHPHNVILDYWTRLGLAGVILFIIIQVSFWRNCLHAVRNFTKRDPLMLALSIGLMGSMADLLAHGWIDNSVFVYDLAFIFAFQLSLSIGLQQIQSRDEL
jgi:O-antigen ligase